MASGQGGFEMYFAQITQPTAANGAAAAGTIILSFLSHVWGILPVLFTVIGTFLGILYYSLTIYQMEPVRVWRANRAARKRLRMIANLKAQERIIVAELAQLQPSPMVKMAESMAAVQVGCPLLLEGGSASPASCPMGSECKCARQSLINQ